MNNNTSKTKSPKNGARYVAARAVQTVLEQKIPLDQAIAGVALHDQLEGRDRAFARLIAATTLRRLGQIDKALAPFMRQEPAAYPLAAIRTGAAQTLFLETPPHAAVGGAVSLLKKSKKTIAFSGMANAVLRRVSEQAESLLAKTSTVDNLPAWLRQSWTESYGKAACAAMADMFAQEPPLDLTVKSEPEKWAQALDAKALPGGTVRKDKIGNITQLPGFDSGDWWAQDISASLPVKLMGDLAGKRVLDMCAAPGGKTLQLAASGANVTALDKSEDRLRRVRENLSRTGLAAEIAAGDGMKWRDPQSKSRGGFDAVLLDAPCSATGIFRRRPDVLHIKTTADVDSLVRVQEKLLLAAALHVKKGGSLIYCTCSLQTREGEDQVARFLKNRSDFRLNPVLASEMYGIPDSITAKGCVRLLPQTLRADGGMDGFFIARFTRC